MVFFNSLTTSPNAATDLAANLVKAETEVDWTIMSAGMELGGFSPVA